MIYSYCTWHLPYWFSIIIPFISIQYGLRNASAFPRLIIAMLHSASGRRCLRTRMIFFGSGLPVRYPDSKTSRKAPGPYFLWTIVCFCLHFWHDCLVWECVKAPNTQHSSEALCLLAGKNSESQLIIAAEKHIVVLVGTGVLFIVWCDSSLTAYGLATMYSIVMEDRHTPIASFWFSVPPPPIPPNPLWNPPKPIACLQRWNWSGFASDNTITGLIMGISAVYW